VGEGQVENQVGLVRERFFTPRLRFKTYDEMNAWLLDKCIDYAKVHHHLALSRLAIAIKEGEWVDTPFAIEFESMASSAEPSS
jgi:hypothetical protein